MTEFNDVVSLFSVDNTLLDNDQFASDLDQHLASTLGQAARERYWAIIERLRADRGYADYLGALERFHLEQSHDPGVLRIASWLVAYPFSERLYPLALEVLQHAQRSGPAVLLPDGDVVFQTHKLNRAGLWWSTGGRVLIYPHKDQELAQIERHYPARRYVVIDHELSILDAIKQIWGERVTTVFVRQGHYAIASENLPHYLPPDQAIDSIGQLLGCELSAIAGQRHVAALRR